MQTSEVTNETKCKKEKNCPITRFLAQEWRKDEMWRITSESSPLSVVNNLAVGSVLCSHALCFLLYRMFLSTVKRLRIMRTSEANGLGIAHQLHFSLCLVFHPFLLFRLISFPSKSFLISFTAPRFQERNDRQRSRPV